MTEPANQISEEFPDVESEVATLTEEGAGKTRLTVTAVYPSVEVRDMVLKCGAAISYDRLEEVTRELMQS